MRNIHVLFTSIRPVLLNNFRYSLSSFASSNETKMDSPRYVSIYIELNSRVESAMQHHKFPKGSILISSMRGTKM